MLNCVVVFVSNATVQAQCIRLIGALAFGNDYVRRRMGEQGIMKSLVAALENHKDDETVQLHICTAITNLTHNSFENRSRYGLFDSNKRISTYFNYVHRFMELNGFEYILNSMDRFKLSSKYQRQACWAILTLSGSDDISKTIANAGADTAIINAMLQHR